MVAAQTHSDRSAGPRRRFIRLLSAVGFFLSWGCLPATVFALEDPVVEMGAALAYRQDYLRWSMAGPNHQPNIISELTWSGLDITQWSLYGRVDLGRVWLNLEAQLGRINDGDSQDSDYSRDDRDGEFSRSNNATDGDGVKAVVGSLGWPLQTSRWPSLRFVPRAELASRELNLRMTRGNQTLSDADNLPPDLAGGGLPPLGPFDGLNSTYHARWTGPGIGVDVEVELAPSWRLLAGYSHHWFEYYGWANWNLISLFEHPKSYEQESTGEGNELRLAAVLQQPAFAVDLQYEYGIWESQGGVTRFFLADGTRVVQPFNGATWRSYSLALGITVPLR